jgi:hypothetical protein
METFITIFKSKEPCNKKKDKYGNDIPNAFYGGTAITQAVAGMGDFENILKKVSEHPNLCISLGYFPNTKDGDKFNIISKDKLDRRIKNGSLKPADREGFYTDKQGKLTTLRTKSRMTFSNIILIDKDNGSETIGQFDEWAENVNKIIPGFKDAEKVIKLSNSARLDPAKAYKLHIFAWAQNPMDLYDFGDRCSSKAYAQGLAVDEKSEKKEHLKNIIFDTKVFSPERIVYEGQPVYIGHEVGSTHIEYRKGNPVIDTTTIQAIEGYGKFKKVTSEVVNADGSTSEKTFQRVNTEAVYGEITLDTPKIYIAKDAQRTPQTEPVTIREILEQDLINKNGDRDGKLCCQIPIEIRDSKSMNGIIRKRDDGSVFLIDNGTKIRYEVNDPDLKNDITDKYYFNKPSNKYYDRNSGALLVAQAVNQCEEGEYNGKEYISPTALFKKNEGISVDGITWEPFLVGDEKELITINGSLYANTYQPPAYLEPDGDDSKIALYLKVITHIIPSEKERNVFLDHMAYTMQFPHKKINWQILLHGKTGIGKDTIVRPLSKYFGDMYEDVDVDDDESVKWGDYRARKKVITFQEVHRPQDRKFTNNLKTLAASTASGMMRINLKGGIQLVQKNLCSMYPMSNYPDPFYISYDDRRWFAINAMEIEALEEEFYTELYDWLDNKNGCELVSKWLLSRELSHFNVGRLPFITDARNALVEESQSDVYHSTGASITLKDGVFDERITVFTTSMLKEQLESTGRKKVKESYLSQELKSLGIKNLGQKTKTIDSHKQTARLWANPNSTKKIKPSWDEYVRCLGLFKTQII